MSRPGTRAWRLPKHPKSIPTEISSNHMPTKQVNITDTIKADPKKRLTQDQKYPPKSHDP